MMVVLLYIEWGYFGLYLLVAKLYTKGHEATYIAYFGGGMYLDVPTILGTLGDILDLLKVRSYHLYIPRYSQIAVAYSTDILEYGSAYTMVPATDIPQFDVTLPAVYGTDGYVFVDTYIVHTYYEEGVDDTDPLKRNREEILFTNNIYVSDDGSMYAYALIFDDLAVYDASVYTMSGSILGLYR